MRRQLNHQEVNFKFQGQGGIVILDKLRTPDNIGMIVRLCVAFELDKVVIITDVHSPPKHRIANISRLGTRKIEIEYNEDVVGVLKKLKDSNFRIIGIELTNDSIDLSEYLVTTQLKNVLIFGNERVGISEEALQLCDVCLHIPISSKISSLNVAMAAAIAVQHFR